MVRLNRRRMLAGLSGLSAALGLAALAPIASSAAEPAHVGQQGHNSDDQLPSPGSSGIEHIVLVMMENRSFDHFLGWLPGHDGKQAGLIVRGRGRSPPSDPPTRA